MNKSLPGDPSLVSSKEEIEELILLGQEIHAIDVEDLFKLPKQSSYIISPSGSYYAYLSPYKRRQNIHVVHVETNEEIRLTDYTDRGVSGLFWANDSHIIFLKDAGGDENFHVFSTDLSGTNVVDLTPFDGVRAEVIDSLEEDEYHIIIALNKNNPTFFEPYLVDLLTGNLNQLATNDDELNPITSWQTNHEGKILLATRIIDGTTTCLLYRDDEDSSFEEVVRTDFKTEIRPLFFDFENKHVVYAASNENRDKLALVRYDLKEGKEVEVLFEHEEVDILNASFSKKRKKLTAVSFTTDRRHRHFYDNETKEAFNWLKIKFGEIEFGLTSHSLDETQWIIHTYTDRSRGAYYYYDTKSKNLKLIAEVSPWIDEKVMATQQSIKFTARDGLVINGYLTLPQDKPGPHPLIVNPHGGPWHRDTWGFNSEIQLFASRGYAVLQINFRGSTGYGRSFWECSFKEWGQSMQDDISDGVQWAIEQGHGYKDRIAIYGGSYGGYATLAGVCFTPDLYKCAMDYVGVSNLFTFMMTVPPYWEPYLKMMYEMVGHPELDRDMMEKYSPALHADKIEVPLFVIQGANDPRVNIDESDQIVKSLKSRGIDVPYMVKYDEGHGFHNEENRFEVYKAMLGFLSKHL